jgi:hypothetical protein
MTDKALQMLFTRLTEEMKHGRAESQGLIIMTLETMNIVLLALREEARRRGIQLTQ